MPELMEDLGANVKQRCNQAAQHRSRERDMEEIVTGAGKQHPRQKSPSNRAV
jgi:hypothetical protein